MKVKALLITELWFYRGQFKVESVKHSPYREPRQDFHMGMSPFGMFLN